MMNRFAILATDRKVHAFRLGQAGFKSVKEEVFAAPYEEMEAGIAENGYFELRHRGEKDMWFFTPIPFGAKFKELHTHVRGRGVPAMNRDFGES
jgi:hypothetical protein